MKDIFLKEELFSKHPRIDINTIIDDGLNTYSDSVASSCFPSPGGGSVACYTAELGISLGLMCVEIIINRAEKRNVQPPLCIINLQNSLISTRLTVKELRKEDEKNLNYLMQIYKQPPSETEEEKYDRKNKIQLQLKECALTQKKLVITLSELIPIIFNSKDYLKDAVVSDYYIMNSNLLSAINSGLSTIVANTSLIEDMGFVNSLNKDISHYICCTSYMYKLKKMIGTVYDDTIYEISKVY